MPVHFAFLGAAPAQETVRPSRGRSGRGADRERYLPAATEVRDFIVTKLLREQRVLREPGGGGQATLDDYVLTARGLLDYSDAVDSRADRELAAQIVSWAWRAFQVDDGWLTAADSLLPGAVAMPLLSDDVLPSATATMADLLQRLTDEPALASERTRMRALLNKGGVQVTQNGVPYFQADELRNTIYNFTGLFCDATCYLGVVPTYVGGFMAFGWGTDDRKLRKVKLSTLKKRFKESAINTRYYSPKVHKAAFALPVFVADIVKSGKKAAKSG